MSVGFLVKRCASMLSTVEQLNQILKPFSKREVEALISSLQRLVERLQGFVETRPHAQPKACAVKAGLCASAEQTMSNESKFVSAWLMRTDVFRSGKRKGVLA